MQGRVDADDVQLATVDVDERDVEEEQIAEGDSGDSGLDEDDMEIPIRGELEDEQEADDEDGHQQSSGEESEDVADGEAALQQVGGKRKQQAAVADSTAGRSSAKRRKQIASLPLAEQEAMALKVLQSGS